MTHPKLVIFDCKRTIRLFTFFVSIRFGFRTRECYRMTVWRPLETTDSLLGLGQRVSFASAGINQVDLLFVFPIRSEGDPSSIW